MGYPLRDQRQNITHHVTSTCIDHEFLLKDEYLKMIFLNQIAKAQEKYIFELNCFTIMDNHFHLVIKIIEGGDSISSIMQYIKSLFARIYNQLTNRTGPFWNSRFKSKIIENAKDPINYFLNTILYLAYNPVNVQIVNNPYTYKFSSFNCYLKKNFKPLVKIKLHQFFFTLGDSLHEAFQQFKKIEKEFYNNIQKINKNEKDSIFQFDH